MPCKSLERMALHCTVGKRCSAVSPRTLQLSSSLKTPLPPRIASSSCTPAHSRYGRQAVGQHSTTTLLVATTAAESASFQDTCHFWVLQSMKWWEGEASKSHPKFKMLHYSLSNATSLNGECQSCCSLCIHDILSIKRPHSPS